MGRTPFRDASPDRFHRHGSMSLEERNAFGPQFNPEQQQVLGIHRQDLDRDPADWGLARDFRSSSFEVLRPAIRPRMK